MTTTRKLLNASASTSSHYPLSFIQRSKESNKETSHVVSGFIISCANQWFYITAGHVIDAINNLLLSGANLEHWRLSDATASGAFQDKAIPYDFNINEWGYVNEDNTGIDYAATPINGLVRLGLEAGGVRALQEGAWLSQSAKYDQLILYGTPSETVNYDDQSVITTRALMISAQEGEPPKSIVQKNPALYAKLIDESKNVVDNIDGMSGGSVFGTRFAGDRLEYGIIGIQSAWLRDSRVLVVYPIAEVANQLRNLMSRVRQSSIKCQK